MYKLFIYWYIDFNIDINGVALYYYITHTYSYALHIVV